MTHMHCWECKTVQPLWKTISSKTKIEPTTQPSNFTLGICPREKKTCIHTKSFTNQATQHQSLVLSSSTQDKIAKEQRTMTHIQSACYMKKWDGAHWTE